MPSVLQNARRVRLSVRPSFMLSCQSIRLPVRLSVALPAVVSLCMDGVRVLGFFFSWRAFDGGRTLERYCSIWREISVGTHPWWYLEYYLACSPCPGQECCERRAPSVGVACLELFEILVCI